MGRLVEANTKAAEKEELRKALEAKDELLKEEASKNASLAADLEKAQAEVGQLREDASQSASLTADLEKAQAEVEELEADAHLLRQANINLVNERI